MSDPIPHRPTMDTISQPELDALLNERDDLRAQMERIDIIVTEAMVWLAKLKVAGARTR